MRTRLLHFAQLLVVIAFALLTTLPFAGQAFSLDGPLVLDYAQHQVEQPLDQHLPDFDYFGVRYDRYLNTHPRLLSGFLSLVLRATGELSEVPIHVALAIFPVIGGIGMFYLGRRFHVSGLAVALLFLASPMLMVSAHTEMVDVPGTSLWIAAMAVFIYGVDKRSNLLLALSLPLLVLAVGVFFQGLSTLPLAIIYLLVNRQFRVRNFLPVVITGLLFAGYLAAVHQAYQQFPRFSYRRQSVFTDPEFLPQLRGNLTVIGGTALFPLVAVFAFFAQRTAAAVLIASAAITGSWSAVKFAMGEYSAMEAVLLSVLLPLGIASAYLLLERPLAARWGARKPSSLGKIQESRDGIFLAAWFFGVLAYATWLLSYPAPRYMLPALPPLILVLLIAWRGLVKRRWLGFALAAAAIMYTFIFSVILSFSYGEGANKNPATADWVAQNYGSAGARIWYDGELGFGHYMKRQGYSMVPNVWNELYAETENPLPLANPQPGDLVVFSPQHGAWLPYPEVLQRVRVEYVRNTYNYEPLSLSGWSRWDAKSIFLPYKISTEAELNDEVTVWKIDETPLPLLEEVKEMYRQAGITTSLSGIE